jgi:hypothetical protein
MNFLWREISTFWVYSYSCSFPKVSYSLHFFWDLLITYSFQKWYDYLLGNYTVRHQGKPLLLNTDTFLSVRAFPALVWFFATLNKRSSRENWGCNFSRNLYVRSRVTLTMYLIIFRIFNLFIRIFTRLLWKLLIWTLVYVITNLSFPIEFFFSLHICRLTS